jgi:hypothetical protein
LRPARRVRTRGLALTATVAMGMGLVGCSGSSSSDSTSTARAVSRSTRPTVPTTTTIPVVVDGCPPGCRFPSNYDATTVLASSATLVAVVTAQGSPGQMPTATSMLRPNEILQTNYHGLIYGDVSLVLTELWLRERQFVNGQSYVVFASYNRGGACVSALYSFNRASQVATLIQSDDGQNNQVLLPGRVVRIPSTTTLADIRARMFPTDGVVYPTDAVEWYCPGP